MSDTAIIIVSIIAMLMVFPLFWSSVIALIAFVGGWRQLSDAYPPEGSESAEWQHGCSASLGASIGLGHYRSSLHVGKDAHYLHLKRSFLFFAYHPKISIPLGDISFHGQGDGYLNRVRLDFERSNIPMRISGNLANWIREGR